MSNDLTGSIAFDLVEVSDLVRLPARPLVSVLMITYNHEPFLAKAIEGVLSQETCFDVELLIGEDCSRDNTRKVALEYQRRFPHKIRVIYSSENVGMHKNFNRILDAAKGDYIAMCEGDDYWMPGKGLGLKIHALEEDLAATAVHSDYFVAYKFFGISYIAESGRKDQVTNYVKDVFGDLVALRWFPITASTVYRKEIISRCIASGFFKTNEFMADYQFLLFSAGSGRVLYIDRATAVYRVWGGSISRSSSNSALNMLRSAERVRRFACAWFNREDLINEELYETELKEVVSASIRTGDFGIYQKSIQEYIKHFGVLPFSHVKHFLIRIIFSIHLHKPIFNMYYKAILVNQNFRRLILSYAKEN